MKRLKRSAAEILDSARQAGREVLLEWEALAIVRSLGIAVPKHVCVDDVNQAANLDLRRFSSDRLVIKVVSPTIAHKTDVGGVTIVPRERGALIAALTAMAERFAGQEQVAGFMVSEFVDYDASLGGELLLGVRWSDAFGPLVTCGPGGIYAEHLAANLRDGGGAAILSPSLGTAEYVAGALTGKAVTPAITGGLRGRAPRLAAPQLVRLVTDFLAFAARTVPAELAELEINPLALTARGPIALDAYGRLASGNVATEVEPRPLAKVRHLLAPRSIAVIGASRRQNPGRMILTNILRAGFEPGRVHVVKPGLETLDGCRCYPDVASLPGRMDLVVIAVAAARVPPVVEDIIARKKAESVILIPGGFGERFGQRDGAEGYDERLHHALTQSRASAWRGPVVNGGNCLGIRSRPGRYDTLFIPRHKLRGAEDSLQPTPLTIIAQSGAFAIARASKLTEPRSTLPGDRRQSARSDRRRLPECVLGEDSENEIFACYVEGFRPLDGRRFFEAAREITASGRPVILYRAGRTPAGARAAASHTASLASDYAATRELARATGVILAESLADFEDLVRVFCLLRDRRATGWRLGAMSNAGFECVAIADHLGRFQLASFSAATHRQLLALLERDRIESIVGVKNPLDVTPILGDEAFAEAARQVLEDDGVDVGVIGCVPLTGALATLAAEPGHTEDVHRRGSVAWRLARLRAEVAKPWVAIIDSGSLYDPMACYLEGHGVPVFRTADRALRALGAFCRFQSPGFGPSGSSAFRTPGCSSEVMQSAARTHVGV